MLWFKSLRQELRWKYYGQEINLTGAEVYNLIRHHRMWATENNFCVTSWLKLNRQTLKHIQVYLQNAGKCDPYFIFYDNLSMADLTQTFSLCGAETYRYLFFKATVIWTLVSHFIQLYMSEVGPKARWTLTGVMQFESCSSARLLLQSSSFIYESLIIVILLLFYYLKGDGAV